MIPDKGKFSSFSEMKSKLKENLAKLIENGKVEKDDEYKKCLSDMTKIEPEVLKEELKQLDEEIKKRDEIKKQICEKHGFQLLTIKRECARDYRQNKAAILELLK